MNEIRSIKVNGSNVKEIKKKMKDAGWVSGHYLTRHGWNADSLRKIGKKGAIKVIQLHNGGTITWYYLQEELNGLTRPHGKKGDIA